MMTEVSTAKQLRKWDVLKDTDSKQLEEVKYFHAFQTYTDDDQQRNSCAMFLTTNDEVFVVGMNNSDNLLALSGEDFAKPVEVKTPRKIESLSGKNIRKIMVSEKFGAALTEDGKLLYWGIGMKQLSYEARGSQYVKLPHEPREDFRIADMACGAHSMTFVTDEKQVLLWGCIHLYYNVFYSFEKVELRKNIEVTAIAEGWYHIALLDQNGEVWTFGYGSVGQLGYKPISTGYTVAKKVRLPDKCVKIECGTYSTLFLLKNGELFACGSNSESDHLCVGKAGNVFVPTKVLLDDNIGDIAATFAWAMGGWRSFYSAASKEEQKFFRWGDDVTLERPQRSQDANSMLDLYSNFKSPVSLGELVRVDVVNLLNPVKPQILRDPLPNRSILNRWSIFDDIDVDLKRNISHFTVYGGTIGSEHVFGAFVKTKTDDVYSWGFNSSRGRELGLPTDKLVIDNDYKTNSPTKVDNLSGNHIKKILINSKGGVAYSDEGILYSWGAKSQPQPVDQTKNKTVVDIACGDNFYIYLLKNGEIYLNGQMSSDFHDVVHQKMDIPSEEKIIGIASGSWHFLILTEAGNVYGFGDGKYGQLGVMWKKDEKSPFAGKKISGIPGVCKKIVCGTSSSFFLNDKGELFACGNNSYADPLGVGHAKTVNQPEKVKMNEKIKDVTGCSRINSFGGLVSTFALKTSSGKIYKWEGGIIEPEEMPKAKFLVEAFEEREIPQSLSLVRLSSLRSDSDEDNESIINLISKPTTLEATPQRNLFADPLYSDVKLKLKDGSIPAHKVLLHTKSAFFRNALTSNKIIDRRNLDLASYNPKAVRALVKWVYDLPIGQRASNMDDVTDFLALAKEDGSLELIETAEDVLMKNMVFDLYQAASAGGNEVDSEWYAIRDYMESSVFP